MSLRNVCESFSVHSVHVLNDQYDHKFGLFMTQSVDELSGHVSRRVAVITVCLAQLIALAIA